MIEFPVLNNPVMSLCCFPPLGRLPGDRRMDNAPAMRYAGTGHSLISEILQDTALRHSRPRPPCRHSSHCRYWWKPCRRPSHPRCQKQSRTIRRRTRLLRLLPVYVVSFKGKGSAEMCTGDSQQRRDSHAPLCPPPCRQQTGTRSCPASSS